MEFRDDVATDVDAVYCASLDQLRLQLTTEAGQVHVHTVSAASSRSTPPRPASPAVSWPGCGLGARSSASVTCSFVHPDTLVGQVFVGERGGGAQFPGGVVDDIVEGGEAGRVIQPERAQDPPGGRGGRRQRLDGLLFHPRCWPVAAAMRPGLRRPRPTGRCGR